MNTDETNYYEVVIFLRILAGIALEKEKTSDNYAIIIS